MKLYGNSRKKKRPDSDGYYEQPHERPRSSGAHEGHEVRRTPQERAEIDRMIANYQRKKLYKRIIIIGIILALAAAGVILWKTFIKPPELPVETPAPTASTPNPSATPKPTTTRRQGVYTLALFGKDVEAGLTDTIMVASFDTENKLLNVVNIPRDTLLNVKRDYKKANGMYSHNAHDMEKVKAELKDLLGFKVDNYIVVDIKAFEEVVDAIDGVDFDVPVNMDYDDDIQNFNVHLMAGYQHLDGEKALGVVRFRQNNEGSPYGVGYPRADIDRIATQQAFLKTVAKKCLSIGNATKVNEFAQIFKDYVDTDLTVGNLAWYGLKFLELTNEDINFMTVPEKYDDFAMGISCCVIELDEWINMINANLNPNREKIKEESLNILTRDSRGVLYSTSGKILE